MVMDLNSLSADIGLPIWTIILVVIWIAVWKALALWKSARRNQPVWFVILCLVNTLGILEILYIFLFSKISLPKVEEASLSRKKKRK